MGKYIKQKALLSKLPRLIFQLGQHGTLFGSKHTTLRQIVFFIRIIDQIIQLLLPTIKHYKFILCIVYGIPRLIT